MSSTASFPGRGVPRTSNLIRAFKPKVSESPSMQANVTFLAPKVPRDSNQVVAAKFFRSSGRLDDVSVDLRAYKKGQINPISSILSYLPEPQDSNTLNMLLKAILTIALLSAVASSVHASPVTDDGKIPNRYIIRFKAEVNSSVILHHHEWVGNALKNGHPGGRRPDGTPLPKLPRCANFKVTKSWDAETVVKGYVATMTKDVADALKDLPEVVSVHQDAYLTQQVDATIRTVNNDFLYNHRRTNVRDRNQVSTQYRWFDNDRLLRGVYTDEIYFLDSGIDVNQAEFVQVGMGMVKPRAFSIYRSGCPMETPFANNPFSCSADQNGHGTMLAAVAGGETLGASRSMYLYSVKVVNQDNTVSVSNILDGLNAVGNFRRSTCPEIAYSRTTSNSVLPGGWNINKATEPCKTNQEFLALTRAATCYVVIAWAGQYDDNLQDVKDRLSWFGCTLVVAAGNRDSTPWAGGDACKVWPAKVPWVITVGGFDQNDNFYANGNGGSCVDILAPAVNYVVPVANRVNQFVYASGTSLAAAFMAGLMASYTNLWKDPEYAPFWNWAVVNLDLHGRTGYTYNRTMNWGTRGRITNVPANTVNLIPFTDFQAAKPWPFVP
ncbi:serine protease [Phlyctochytrium bullatum]|nr:serine protease [Phlyctochytrium bullatum]